LDVTLVSVFFLKTEILAGILADIFVKGLWYGIPIIPDDFMVAS